MARFVNGQYAHWILALCPHRAKKRFWIVNIWIEWEWFFLRFILYRREPLVDWSDRCLSNNINLLNEIRNENETENEMEEGNEKENRGKLFTLFISGDFSSMIFQMIRKYILRNTVEQKTNRFWENEGREKMTALFAVKSVPFLLALHFD